MLPGVWTGDDCSEEWKDILGSAISQAGLRSLHPGGTFEHKILNEVGELWGDCSGERGQ